MDSSIYEVTIPSYTKISRGQSISGVLVTLTDQLKWRCVTYCYLFRSWRRWRSRRKSTYACGSIWTKSSCPSWTTTHPSWRSRNSSRSAGMRIVPDVCMTTSIPLVWSEPVTPVMTLYRKGEETGCSWKTELINRHVTPPAVCGVQTLLQGRRWTCEEELCADLRGLLSASVCSLTDGRPSWSCPVYLLCLCCELHLLSVWISWNKTSQDYPELVVFRGSLMCNTLDIYILL